MKKIYEIPNVIVVKIKTSKMLATSLGVSDKAAQEGVMLSRRGGSIWDDDEE